MNFFVKEIIFNFLKYQKFEIARKKKTKDKACFDFFFVEYIQNHKTTFKK